MIRQPSNVAALRAAWRVANGLPDGDPGPCWWVTNADRPRLYVHGMIGVADNDAADFVKTVHAIDAKQMDLFVNSQGGFVWDSITMYEALRSHPATVHSHVTGVAASAASFLALAGDTVDTATGSRWMVHDAQTIAMGSPADIREAADVADAVSNDIASIYAARAGGTAKSWRAAMTKTTWYSAAEAVDAHLADRVTGDKKTSGASNLAGRMLRARAAVALEGVSK